MVCAFLTDGAAIPGTKKRRSTRIWISMGTGTEASQGGKHLSCCILNSHKQHHILPALVVADDAEIHQAEGNGHGLWGEENEPESWAGGAGQREWLLHTACKPSFERWAW